MDCEPNSRGILVPVDPKPVSRAALGEVATTGDGRDITRGYVDALPLLQPTDTVLASRYGDLRLYEELLRDDQVAATFGQRRLAVTSAEWHVAPGGTKPTKRDKQAAAALEEELEGLEFDRITDRMLYGVFYGYAVAEVLWGRVGARLAIADIKVRKARRFGFAPDFSLRLRTTANPDGEVLPDKKFWVFSTGGDTDDEPYGLGLGHYLWWPIWFKRNGVKFWSIFLEKFGQPTVHGKFPPGTTRDDQQKLLDVTQAIASDTGIITPEGMQLEMLEALRQGTTSYEPFITMWNSAVAKVVLGQTMTTEAAGGQYKAEVQQDVRDDLVKADADLVCGSFNRTVARWWTQYNFPGAETPKVWREVEQPEDLNSAAERDSKIAQAHGVRMTIESVNEIYPGDWERAGAAETGQPLNPGPAPALAAFAQIEDIRDPADLADRLMATLADAELQGQMEAVLAPILRQADEAPDALLAELGSHYPDMDASQLTETLARILFVAETWGRLQAQGQ